MTTEQKMYGFRVTNQVKLYQEKCRICPYLAGKFNGKEKFRTSNQTLECTGPIGGVIPLPKPREELGKNGKSGFLPSEVAEHAPFYLLGDFELPEESDFENGYKEVISGIVTISDRSNSQTIDIQTLPCHTNIIEGPGEIYYHIPRE